MKRSFGLWLVIPGLSMAGCAQGPSESDYDDVAASVGALTANDSGGEMGSMQDGIAVSQGNVPEGLSAQGSGSFEGDRAGLRYEYSITCLDEAGATLSVCGGETDSARLTVDWSGDLTLPRFEASISRTGDWTLTGLQSEVAQLDGEGTFDVDTSFQALFTNETRTFHLSYDAEYEAVRFQTADLEPLGGEARYAVHAERTRERGSRSVEAEFDMDAVLTFTGNGDARLVLDEDHSYTIDLGTGGVTKQ